MLTILVWPFPLARASLPPLIHVVAILVLWQLVQAGYYAVSAAAWHKTAGMHVLGLELRDAKGLAPGRSQAVAWALAASLFAIVQLLPALRSRRRMDTAQRLSGVRVVLSD